MLQVANETEVKAIYYTDQQEKTLAKHPNHVGYFLLLVQGWQPKEIEENYGIKRSSTKKYLKLLP